MMDMTTRNRRRTLILIIGILSAHVMNAQYWATPTDYDYSGMAEEITAGATGKYEQAEKIYRWLCENIEYDVNHQFFTADETRENMKGVCHGYCELFYQLGKAVGLEVKIIPGFCKNIMNTISIDRHSWIIAVTERGDIFVDPTWGAGYVVDNVFYKNDSNMAWFDVDPYIMATSHIPIESRFQLLDIEMDDDTFRKVPHIHPCLENLGLDAKTGFEKGIAGTLSLPVIYGAIGSNMGFRKIPLEGTLDYGSRHHIEYAENDSYDLIVRMDNHELPSHVWVTENGITSIDFMVTAFEELRIVVLPKGVKSGDVVGGFGYKIRMPDVIPEEALAAIEEYDPYMLPELKEVANLEVKWYKHFGFDGKAVLDTIRTTGVKAVPQLLKEMEKLEMIDMPLSSPLKAGKEYIFHFKANPKEQWAIINNSYFFDKWEEKPMKEGEFIYKFKIPEPGRLSIGVHIGGNRYQHAVMWIVE